MITIAGTAYGQMADSINPASLASLPFTPDALLGYVDGRWPDYQTIAAQHHGIPCFGLTVFGSPSVGDGVDCEWGDADPAQAAQAVKAELSRGVDRPILYCPQSWAGQCVAACMSLGVARARYRLVTAHYQGPTMPGAPTAGMHICGAICGCPVDADATQWNSYPAYDISLLKPGFLAATPAAAPAPFVPTTTTTGDTVQRTTTQVRIIAGQGWCYNPVPASNLVSVLVMDEAPAVVGGYDNIPAFAGLATDQNNPDGVLVFRGGADGVYGVTVISA